MVDQYVGPINDAMKMASQHSRRTNDGQHYQPPMLGATADSLLFIRTNALLSFIYGTKYTNEKEQRDRVALVSPYMDDIKCIIESLVEKCLDYFKELKNFRQEWIDAMIACCELKNRYIIFTSMIVYLYSLVIVQLPCGSGKSMAVFLIGKILSIIDPSGKTYHIVVVCPNRTQLLSCSRHSILNDPIFADVKIVDYVADKAERAAHIVLMCPEGVALRDFAAMNSEYSKYCVAVVYDEVDSISEAEFRHDMIDCLDPLVRPNSNDPVPLIALSATMGDPYKNLLANFCQLDYSLVKYFGLNVLPIRHDLTINVGVSDDFKTAMAYLLVKLRAMNLLAAVSNCKV